MASKKGNCGENKDNEIKTHGCITHYFFFEIVTVRNDDILKKNVVLSSEGLVWTTTQAFTAGSHSDTTMNIVLYNKVQCATQRIPSIAMIDRRLSQRAILGFI
jgi:hypothetical protein